MRRQILADEGVSGYLIRELRKNFEIEWVLEGDSAITDREIIKIAKFGNKILITEDKDFAEWVFSHGINDLTIIFLRYEKSDFAKIVTFMNPLLQELSFSTEDRHEFITINRNKIWRRKI